ncbi:major facilitator superfamily transporter [Kingella kingae ATCC 23330]|uniref:Major facilitator superfamily transporter n=1 Tax=Kingella kingae ATCC 23330 TaxID=887327 RepID=F5S5D2_KINKI|nr:major facilitator superfamily transporter [Kingella kingae ATCC 23330]
MVFLSVWIAGCMVVRLHQAQCLTQFFTLVYAAKAGFVLHKIQFQDLFAV